MSKRNLPDAHIHTRLVQEAVKYTPSAFNTQTGRAVVLFGEASKKIWKTVEEFYLPNFKNDGAFCNACEQDTSNAYRAVF